MVRDFPFESPASFPLVGPALECALFDIPACTATVQQPFAVPRFAESFAYRRAHLSPSFAGTVAACARCSACSLRACLVREIIAEAVMDEKVPGVLLAEVATMGAQRLLPGDPRGWPALDAAGAKQVQRGPARPDRAVV